MTNKPQFVGEKVRVSDVFDLRMGKTPSRKSLSYWRDGNHDWVSIADLGSFGKYVGSSKERINDLAIAETGIKPAPANTVLMSFKLSLGKTAITTVPVYTNEAIMAFVDKGVYPVDSSFMYHQCRTKDWTAGTNTAVMGKTLNKKTLGQQMVFLPGLTQQKAIARQLDFIEYQLDNSNEQLSRLDSLVKSRFVEMFENGKTDTVRLGDWCEKITKGTTPTTAGYSFIDDGINFIKVETLSDSGDFIPDKLAHISCECHAALKRSQLKEGDLLFSIAGAIGRIAIVTSDVMPANTNQALAIIRLNKNAPFELSFLKQALSSSAVVAVAEKLKRGVAQINLSLKDVGNFLIPCPDMETQRGYSAFVTQIDKSRFVAQQQIEKLQMLYDSLAQEYFGD